MTTRILATAITEAHIARWEVVAGKLLAHHPFWP
jgi:hypothetical protein